MFEIALKSEIFLGLPDWEKNLINFTMKDNLSFMIFMREVM